MKWLKEIYIYVDCINIMDNKVSNKVAFTIPADKLDQAFLVFNIQSNTKCNIPLSKFCLELVQIEKSMLIPKWCIKSLED